MTQRRRELWPTGYPEGPCSVAARYSSTDSSFANQVAAALAAWLHEMGPDRLEVDLVRPPFIEQQQADAVDVVFDGRPGSKMWKDCLVSFVSAAEQARPALRPSAFVDRRGGTERAILGE